MQTRLATNQVKIQQAGDEIMARMQQELRSMTGKLEKEWYVGGRVRWDACSILIRSAISAQVTASRKRKIEELADLVQGTPGAAALISSTLSLISECSHRKCQAPQECLRRVPVSSG